MDYENGIVGKTAEGNPIWLHNPDYAVLEYWINLEDWLPPGDMLDAGSTVTVDPPLNISNVEIQDGYKLIGWVDKSPGASGDVPIHFHWVTTDGREDERTGILRCVPR